MLDSIANIEFIFVLWQVELLNALNTVQVSWPEVLKLDFLASGCFENSCTEYVSS